MTKKTLLIAVGLLLLLQSGSAEFKTGPPKDKPKFTPEVSSSENIPEEDVIEIRPRNSRQEFSGFSFSDGFTPLNKDKFQAPTVINSNKVEKQIQKALSLAKDVWKHNRTIASDVKKLINSNERIASAVNEAVGSAIPTVFKTEKSIGGFFINSTTFSFPPMTFIILAPTLSWPLATSPEMSTRFQIAYQWFFPIEDPLFDLIPALQATDFFRKKRDLTESEHESVNSVDPFMIKGPKDRKSLYDVIQLLLQTFSLDGEGCLLRAICETQGGSLSEYGFFGEILEMLLSPSMSKENLPKEYLEAEKTGSDQDCTSYYKRCKKSMYIDEGYSK